MNETDNKCPVCRGYKRQSMTTFTVDLKFGIVVVRNVPAMVCEQCGEEWIADKEAQYLEEIVQDARQKHSMIEVADFSDLVRVVG